MGRLILVLLTTVISTIGCGDNSGNSNKSKTTNQKTQEAEFVPGINFDDIDDVYGSFTLLTRMQSLEYAFGSSNDNVSARKLYAVHGLYGLSASTAKKFCKKNGLLDTSVKKFLEEFKTFNELYLPLIQEAKELIYSVSEKRMSLVTARDKWESRYAQVKKSHPRFFKDNYGDYLLSLQNKIAAEDASGDKFGRLFTVSPSMFNVTGDLARAISYFFDVPSEGEFKNMLELEKESYGFQAFRLLLIRIPSDYNNALQNPDAILYRLTPFREKFEILKNSFSLNEQCFNQKCATLLQKIEKDINPCLDR